MKNKNFLHVTVFAILLLFSYNFSNAQFAGYNFKPDNSLKIDKNIKLKLNEDTKKSSPKIEETSHDSDVYIDNKGFTLFDGDKGQINFTLMAYARYLNQTGLDSTYTNAFGKKSIIKERKDIQLNKANLKFRGWFMDPKLRFLIYAWTSNTLLGAVSQVVVAGNLSYTFNDNFTLIAGIDAVPTTRTTEGNFPYWLNVDNRELADEYFRGSYTTGLFARGKIVDRLNYIASVTNNLNQFGIDASALDAGLNTYAIALNWLPTTGEFGINSSFGDFEFHQKLATRIGGHFAYSKETRQGQPQTEGFDNTQVRLSDGTPIFTPFLFGPGTLIDELVFKMASVDAGIKIKGFALDAEFYWRWLSNFTGPGTDSLGFNLRKDNGFQAMASHMVIKSSLQFYTAFSQIFGNYGNPWGARVGVNFFPFKNQAVRWNFQYSQLYKSPVGGNFYPYTVGATGGVFNTDFIVNF